MSYIVAGYDISSKKLAKAFFTKFNKLIGIKHVVLIHLNDSKPEVGKRVDRHENLGQGHIGLDGIGYVVKYAKERIPLILETPGKKNWTKEIEIIKKLSK